MASVAENLEAVLGRMGEACRRAGREPGKVELIAVSKTFPAEAVQEAYEAGQRLFGESRQQEAAPKIDALPADIRWHFIGGVQRNKVRKILPAFDAVHAIDSLRLAACVSQVAGELGRKARVFLEVNLAGEASKGGFDRDALRRGFDELRELPNVEWLGLMTIPPADREGEEARPFFATLRDLRDVLRQDSGLELPHLSMGMSGDYEAAILEGATLVRVGSAIFGKRAYRVDGELG